MTIPGEADINEDRFSDSIEFPFIFADIKSIEVSPSIAFGEEFISNDFESAKTIAATVDTLGCEIAADRIVIRDEAT
jgi:hypothetical protein